MKYSFLLLMSFLFQQTLVGQTPELIEINFRLYNESGQLLNCDSLQSDTIDIIEQGGQFESYAFDSTTNYHTIMLMAHRSNFSMRWIRNEKSMCFIFDLYDTTGIDLEHYSIDRVKFEEGNYDVEIRNNDKREIYETSRLKYFENIKINTENMIQHYTWDSLEAFKTASTDWRSKFYHPLDKRFLKTIVCR